MIYHITQEAREFATSKGLEQTYANRKNPQNAGTISDTGERSASPYTIMGKLGEYAFSEILTKHGAIYDYVGEEIVYKGSAKGPDFIIDVGNRDLEVDVKTRMHPTKNSWCRQEHSMCYDVTVFSHCTGDEIVFNGWLGKKDFGKFETCNKYGKIGYDIANTKLRPMDELMKRIINNEK